jgi:hypothetical protein
LASLASIKFPCFGQGRIIREPQVVAHLLASVLGAVGQFFYVYLGTAD